jgi:hypothetical protein
MNSDAMIATEPEKPKPTVDFDFWDNKELQEMFQGVGLGDKFTVVITGKVTRLSEHGVTIQPTHISSGDEDLEEESGVGEDSLENEPVSVVLNAG